MARNAGRVQARPRVSTRRPVRASFDERANTGPPSFTRPGCSRAAQKATIELPVVAAVDVAVAVEIEPGPILTVAGPRAEGGAEELAVRPVDVAVPVAVAEEP